MNDTELHRKISDVFAASITQHLLASPTLIDEITSKIITDINLLSAISDAVTKKIEHDVYDSLHHDIQRVSTKTEAIAGDQTKLTKLIAELDDKQDELEQYSRRNCLLIHGISETDKEDTTDLAINTFQRRMNLKVDRSAIDRSHRLGRIKTNSTSGESPDTRKPRPIIVKFVSYAERHEVFRNKRTLKSSGVVISENLTLRRQKLLRDASNLDQVQAAWTTDGKVICLLQNKKRITLTSPKDFNKLI